MLISDEELEKAFRNVNFGVADHRALLNASVLKKLVGYHCGWTITCIMKDLKLIGETEKVTKKGILLVREAYSDLMMRQGG